MGLVARRRVVVGWCVGLASLLSAGPAIASGVSTSKPPVHPTGYTRVVTARTVNHRTGVHIRVVVSRGRLFVVAPKGERRGLQLSVVSGNRAAVKRHLARTFRHRRVISAFGIQLRKGHASVRASKWIRVTFARRGIARRDRVVVYSPRTGKFKAVAARVRKGKITLRLRATEFLAIIS